MRSGADFSCPAPVPGARVPVGLIDLIGLIELMGLIDLIDLRGLIELIGLKHHQRKHNLSRTTNMQNQMMR